MNFKKICFLLITLLCIHTIVFAYNEDEEGFPSSYDPDSEYAKRNAELHQMATSLESSLNAQESNVNNQSAPQSTAEAAAQANEDYDQAGTDFSAVTDAAEDETNANKEESEDKKNTENSQIDGDPVRLTQGTYEQSETDFCIGNNISFTVERLYSSENKIYSSFGYGWSTNLDERILYGIEVNSEEIEQALIEYADSLKTLIEDFTNKLKSAYNVSSLEYAHKALNDRITNCSNIYSATTSLYSSLCSLESDAEGYPAQARITGLKNKAAGIMASISSKESEIRAATKTLTKDLALLNRFENKYNQILQELAVYTEKRAQVEERKEKNKYARFAGMDSWYEETGLDTITLIDENAFPHILYETEQASGVWINQNEKQIVNCTKQECGLKLTMANGITKLFDETGFLVQITDLNGNQIIIHRNQDGKINYVQTSSGEKIGFTYTENRIATITNLRAPSQKVFYNYTSEKLCSFKDSEGDLVLMEYDSSGRLSVVKKGDGSSVSFYYGEVTANGKYLTTQTQNEEGYSEFFIYDINELKTVYKDHDGNETTYYYDKNHRTIRNILSDGTTTTNTYDNSGNLVQTTTNGNTTNFSYDSKGNKSRASYSDGSFELFNYNNYNQLEYYRNRDGLVYEYHHDYKGNLTEYYLGGKLVCEQKFDNRGNIIERTVYGEKSIVTEYEYDSFSNMISQTTAGIKTTYEYDTQNRLTKTLKNEAVLSTINYNLKEIIKNDFNGLQTIWIQNCRKDITQIIQKDTITGVIHKIRIEYDKRHLPVKLFTGDGNTETLTAKYTYTAEGKIKSESLQEQDSQASYVKTYDYDKGQISRVNQCITTNDEVISYLYKYQNKPDNQKLLTITDPLGHSTSYEYDAWENLISQTNACGETTHNSWTFAGKLKASQNAYGGFYKYEYDSSGNLIKSGEENANAVSAAYNTDGSLKSQTDRYGKTTCYSYDNAGRLLCERSNSKTIWYEYDDFDRLTRQSIGNSHNVSDIVYYVTYDYSLDGRTVTITEGSKYKTINFLDAFGNVIKQTDGNGNTRVYEYDCNNLLIAAYDAYNNKTSYEYNVLGKIKSVTLPCEEKTEYFYNSLGLLIKVKDDCGTFYTAEYDKAGRLIKEKNRADSEKTYEYDNTGRITKILCGGQTIEEYSYGERGRPLTVKDGNGSEYFYSYDSFGRLINEKNRLGLIQDYYYDEEGTLKEQKSFDGSTTTISYSANQTVRTVLYSDGSKNQFVYDAMGNIIQAQNMYGNTCYEYDKGGRLIVQKDITTGEEIRFEYDAAGNRTRLISSNRETRYTYDANNDLKEIFDNKQRVSVQLEYNKNGQEVLRKFGNGTKEQTCYDKAGRITLKCQKNSLGEILWGEGYIYGADGKRTATVDNKAFITLYEYDKLGRLSAVYYPYSKNHEELLKKEAQTNGLSVNGELAINRYLSTEEKTALTSRLNEMQYTLAYSLTAMQLFIKESYTYDKNGNRTAKQTSFGKIEYSYDQENRLVSSGSHGQIFVNYTYDKAGNLLSEESALKTTKYACNSQNRLIYCEVIDKETCSFTQTKYAYDAFGRRVLVQDFEESAMRTLYDGFTFDVIKQSPVFTNGTFNDSYETGIRWNQAGQPTGERYRYLNDDNASDNNRYFYLNENTYKAVTNRYNGERTQFTVNGTISAQASSGSGTEYFSTDLFGSVRQSSDNYGSSKQTFDYDAFGTLVQGELSGTSDFGYAGKTFDTTASLYNYGYRDYNPAAARFTTTDPIRDGQNWFTYCNGDPVNFLDLWGLFYYRGNEQKASAAHKSTQVYIYRNDDGIGNDFNSTRMIFKDGVCVYVDQVGANCTEQYYNGTTNLTEPDGTYYYSFENLQPNADGTYDSDSYHNVIRHKTNDKNIPEDIRNTINNAPGDFLDHANQKKDKDIYSTTNPYSAGCTIGMGGQEHQDKFMETLLDGVDRPEEIQRIIVSNNNKHKKGD